MSDNTDHLGLNRFWELGRLCGPGGLRWLSGSDRLRRLEMFFAGLDTLPTGFFETKSTLNKLKNSSKGHRVSSQRNPDLGRIENGVVQKAAMRDIKNGLSAPAYIRLGQRK